MAQIEAYSNYIQILLSVLSEDEKLVDCIIRLSINYIITNDELILR